MDELNELLCGMDDAQFLELLVGRLLQSSDLWYKEGTNALGVLFDYSGAFLERK